MAEQGLLEVKGVGLEFRGALELLIQAHKAELHGTSTHPGRRCLSQAQHGHEDLHVEHAPAQHQESDEPHRYESGGSASRSAVSHRTSLKQWLGEASTSGSPAASTKDSTPNLNAAEATVQQLNSEKSSQKDITQSPKQTPSPRQTRSQLCRGVTAKLVQTKLDPADEEQWRTRSITPQKTVSSAGTNRNKAAGCDRQISIGTNQVFNMQGGLKSDAAIDEPDYDVVQCYYEKGCLQAIARNHTFGYVTLAVIGINAVYMGVESDYNRADSFHDAHEAFIAFEVFLCVFFTVELSIRFGAFKFKSDCWRDGWFKFDAALLLVIWWETWIMPYLFKVTGWDSDDVPTGPLQLIRLLRLARLARLLRAFPELVTMVKGMLLATRAVGSAMLLLIIAIYAWAIAMHSFMKEDAETNRQNGDAVLYYYWGTVTRCMMTLMGNGTLGDSIGIVMRGVASKPEALVALIAFIIFSMLTVLNMLVGVLCEVVTEVAHAEKDNRALAKLKSSLLVMLKRIDMDGSGDISKPELLGLLQDEEAVAAMEELNIDVDYFVDILDMHYHIQEDVKISHIMTLLIHIQGDRPTTVAHLCSFTTFIHWAMEIMVDTLHGEIQFVKQSMNSSAQMMHDLDFIKKELASLTNSGCRTAVPFTPLSISKDSSIRL